MSSRLAWPSQIQIPGDKSISHRMLLMAAMAEGVSELVGLSEGKDVQSTIGILQSLNFDIKVVPHAHTQTTTVVGKGFHRWLLSNQILDCGNSGTTARHIMALVAGGVGQTQLVGDSSLSLRPMRRIADPLGRMGAKITLTETGSLPAKIEGQNLGPASYNLPVPSAQVKSALMLAACNSKIPLQLTGRLEGRDHTENFIPFFGGQVSTGDQILVPLQNPWHPVTYTVPKDPSALANWVAAALLTERTVTFENVLLNPSRLGFFRSLISMGADIELEVKMWTPEQIGTVHVRPSKLKGVAIGTPSSHYIDEAPLLALLASQAEGQTVMTDLSELRFKECDRFQVTVDILQKLGVQIQAKDDTWIIEGLGSGRDSLRPAKIESHDDHRMTMLGLIAGMITDVEIDSLQSLAISDPYMSELVC